MDRHRFKMEASREFRPCFDETPGSNAHHHRCARPVSKTAENAKTGDKVSMTEKTEGSGR